MGIHQVLTGRLRRGLSAEDGTRNEDLPFALDSSSQRAQYPLVKEYIQNHNIKAPTI